jgi:AraC-like DNA-binding protein
MIHRRTDVPPEIARFLGCPVEYGSPVDEVIFPVEAVDAMLLNADPYLNSLLSRYCEQILSSKGAKRGDWRTRAENVVAPLLPHGEASAKTVAKKLAISPRTLARRLGAEGTNFLGLVKELRLHLARDYLESGLSIAKTAWLLGYKEPSAFSHAFKRWTGASPKSVRIA